MKVKYNSVDDIIDSSKILESMKIISKVNYSEDHYTIIKYLQDIDNILI